MEDTVPQTGEKKKMNMGIIVVAIVVIGALGIVGYEAFKPKDKASQPAAIAPKKVEEATPEPTKVPTIYKNGTYNVIGNYTSPGGPEEIDVTVTLTDDIITEVGVVSKAFRATSKEKQGIFIENYKPMVVGKKLDEVKLDTVSSSSLTPKGFNDALEKVKEQAKV